MEKLSITSRHYRIERLLGQLGDAKEEPAPPQIGWQERLTMHYRIIPRDISTNSCTVSECHFMEGNSGQSSTPTMTSTDYLCLEHAHDDFQVSVMPDYRCGRKET